MKSLLILFVIILWSCSHHSELKTAIERMTINEKDLFLVTNIDTVNSYYFINCKKNSYNYKIISYKKNGRCNCLKVREGNYYHFDITGYPNYSKSDNPLLGFIGLDECFQLEENTWVCEGQNLVLCTTDNIAGLCYFRNGVKIE